MAIKLISPNTLDKLRRGAEQMYRKHRDVLVDQTVTVRQDLAKELGLKTKDVKAEPVNVSSEEVLGLFNDEPSVRTVIPTVMTIVPLIDYIEALQKFKIDDSSDPTNQETQLTVDKTKKSPKPSEV